MAIIIEDKTSSIKEIQTLNCLAEVERLEQFLTNERTPQNPPYDFKITVLPDWTNENLEFEGQILNLNKLTCSCKKSHARRKLHPKNDLRLICSHIYEKILSSEKHRKIFDELTLLLIKSVLLDGEKMLIISRNSKGGSTFYIGGNNKQNSYNVYQEADNKWMKYVYSVIDKKWKGDYRPINSKTILETLKRNEFIFNKYLSEDK
jgi:hypothetical protein